MVRSGASPMVGLIGQRTLTIVILSFIFALISWISTDAIMSQLVEIRRLLGDTNPHLYRGLSSSQDHVSESGVARLRHLPQHNMSVIPLGGVDSGNSVGDGKIESQPSEPRPDAPAVPVQSPVARIPSQYPPRPSYPARKDLGACPPLFGHVAIHIAYVEQSMINHYKVAQQTMRCYLKGVNYTVFMVDLDKDELVKRECSEHKQLFFKKHCAVKAYLNRTDWMVVLDADAGVANPNHCFEEWIDPRVSVVLYERFFNWEIASGNYIIRNDVFGHQFLDKWADMEFEQNSEAFTGADNGALQLHVLRNVIPDAQQEAKNCAELWAKARDYDTYMGYVVCCKIALGATRLWPGKVRIYRRAHGWIRDGFLTTDEFSPNDFMLHGWKNNAILQDNWESPFHTAPNPETCTATWTDWPYRPGKSVNATKTKMHLANFERSAGDTFPNKSRVHPFLTMADVRDCYPDCERLT